MKKPLLIVSTVALFMFASCENENTTNPEPIGQATIKGAIVSDLDMDDDVGDPQLEKIPAGVQVYILDDNTGAVLTTVTTTADGYTATIDVGAPRDIVIVVGDFETTVNFDIGGGDFENKKALYNLRQGADLTVIRGASFIQNIEIDQPEAIDF
jgi:hypothetical protein